MPRLTVILLVILTLLSQWSWAEHAYHEHDEGELCEICQAAGGQGHALLSSLPLVAVTTTSTFTEQLTKQNLFERTLRYYATRAPPPISLTKNQ